MVENLVEQMRASLSPLLIIFLISLLPVLELRGGLIAAALLGVDWLVAFPICVVGNLLPIPLELLFIRKLMNALKRFRPFRTLIDKLDSRARKKGEEIRKYKIAGLFVLVAIPLPGTGAWTGGLVADVLDIRMRTALPVIGLGVVAAGLITSAFSYVIPSLF